MYIYTQQNISKGDPNFQIQFIINNITQQQHQFSIYILVTMTTMTMKMTYFVINFTSLTADMPIPIQSIQFYIVL